MAQPSLTQVAFRGRNDDGTEITATWIAIQGDDWSQDVDAKFRARFLCDEQNSKAWTADDFELYYSYNSGTYTLITATTPIQYATSAHYTNGDDCLERLTGGSGTFLADNNGMRQDAGGNNSGAINQYFDTEFCLNIDAAQVDDADTFLLHVYRNGVAFTGGYTDTPVITVVKAGGTEYQEAVAGILNTSGIPIRQIRTDRSGVLSSSGVRSFQIARGLAGALASAGIITKQVATDLAGALNSSGILASAKVVLRSLAGALVNTGVVTKQMSTSLTGVLNSTGEIIKNTATSLAGVLASSGIVTYSRMFYQTLIGLLEFKK